MNDMLVCPHCGNNDGVWFDRSRMYDGDGNEFLYEGCCYRCNFCGRNINAPVEYYRDMEEL